VRPVEDGRERENHDVNSRERLLAALSGDAVDYTPCSFMIFFNLSRHCGTEPEFVERQLDLGLDAFVRVGSLEHWLHPDARLTEWVEEQDGRKTFCRRIDTPKGPLTQRVRQDNGWPTEGDFPIFNDWIVGRAEEILVKPERDLDKLQYLLDPFKDEQIETLRESGRQADAVSDEHGILKVGGWKSVDRRVMHYDSGVMGCDAMAWLSGYEEIMVLSLTRPGLIREYANIIHEWNMRQIEIYLDVTDPDIIWRRGWYETTEFWTPDAYRQIIAPTMKREVDLVHQAGKKFGYIITSAFLPILDDILDTGIDVLIGLDPEEGKGTDLNLVKMEFAERGRAIWGGVSGAVTVEQGTAEDTKKAVEHALRVLGEGGGFILSPVDNVREDTENARRNTQAFIDAWKALR